MSRVIIFLLACSLLVTGADAQPETAEAYLITVGGDTLHRTLILPRDFNWDIMHPSFNRELMVLETDSTARTIWSQELAGFGIRKRRLEAHYRSLPLPDGKRRSFFQVAQFGSPLMLYYGGIPASAYSAGIPYGSSQYRNIDKPGYLIDSGGKILVVKETAAGPLRKKLRGFFQSEPAALSLIDKLVKTQSDIPELVSELNMLRK
jgi:hypothetical protein